MLILDWVLVALWLDLVIIINPADHLCNAIHLAKNLKDRAEISKHETFSSTCAKGSSSIFSDLLITTAQKSCHEALSGTVYSHSSATPWENIKSARVPPSFSLDTTKCQFMLSHMRSTIVNPNPEP